MPLANNNERAAILLEALAFLCGASLLNGQYRNPDRT